MNGIPLLNDKCKGAFVASAIGDALGWPNEFRSSNLNKTIKPLSNFIDWQRRSGGRYWNHTENILAGEYSDDTQMILAVARSLFYGNSWSNHFITNELPFWLEYERGGGSAMLHAAISWKNKIEPWLSNDKQKYFNAGGNGAAMRILPHVILLIRSSSFEIIASEVVTDAILTHGHPRAIVGALCYAYALYYLMKKESTLSFGELVNAVIIAKSEWGKFPKCFPMNWLDAANNEMLYNDLWINTVETTVSSLEIASNALNKGVLDSESKTLFELGCFDKNINGAGDVAAVASIYLASKYANNPILGIKSAANAIGIDTDTIASMTGGLLGTICGMEWIPVEWKLVQDFDCLVRMASFLLSENGIETTVEYINYKNQGVAERTSMGIYKKVKSYELPSGKTGIVHVTKYVTILGQTFYIKKYSREKALDNNELKISAQPTQNCSLIINSLQVTKIINDHDLNTISFMAVLRIFEMYNHGITDITYISQKTSVSLDTVKKIISFIITDNQ